MTGIVLALGYAVVAVMAMGSLVGHVVYGAVLGRVYGPVRSRERAVPRPNVRSHD